MYHHVCFKNLHFPLSSHLQQLQTALQEGAPNPADQNGLRPVVQRIQRGILRVGKAKGMVVPRSWCRGAT